MQKSMTGFGKAEVAANNGKTFTAEIRSLNSKQLDLGLRLPVAYRELENDIRSLVSKRVVRGKVDLTISVASTEVATASRIDKALLASYIKQISTKNCGYTTIRDNTTPLKHLMKIFKKVLEPNNI